MCLIIKTITLPNNKLPHINLYRLYFGEKYINSSKKFIRNVYNKV